MTDPVTAARRGAAGVDGRSVTYRYAGSGAPVVVLGPATLSSLHAVALIEELAAEHCVLAVDPPGFGLSDPLPGRYGVGDLATRVDGLVSVLGLAEVALVGVGTGGTVAIELARRRPDRYRLLVLDDVPLLPALERARLGVERGTPAPVESDGSHLLHALYRRRAELCGAPSPDVVAPLHDLRDPEVVAVALHAAVLDRLDAGDAVATTEAAVWAYDPEPVLLALEVPVVRSSDVVQALQPVRALGGPVPVPPPADRGRWTVAFPQTRRGQLAARRHRPPTDAGTLPLVALHTGPLAGESLLPFCRDIVAGREVVLLDTFGTGDSDKPGAGESLAMTELAALALEAVTALGIDRFDLYGTHSGAVLALEVALAAPDRVERLVLDGVPLYSGEEAAELWDGYFIDLTPRWDGGHLLAAWSNVVDVMTWYPWYARDAAHRRSVPVPSAAQLHRRFVQFAKGGATYACAYQGVVDHQTAARLPGLRVPTVFCRVGVDPLGGTVERCLALVPGSTLLELSGDSAADGRAVAGVL